MTKPLEKTSQSTPENHRQNELPQDKPSPEIKEVIASTRKWFFPEYSLLNPGEEVLSQWIDEVESLLNVLKNRDYLEVKKSMKKNGRLKFSPSVALEMLDEEIFTPEELKMFGIGIWILLNKSPWHGMTTAVASLARGGEHPLSIAIEPDRGGNCFEVAVLVDVLTKKYGIQGSRQQLAHHHLWIAESGHILDPMYGYQRAGFFKNEEDYREFLKICSQENLSQYAKVPLKSPK